MHDKLWGVARFTWYEGKVAVQRYKLGWTSATGRLCFYAGQGPGEACFNGLKPGRLDQFHFYRPGMAVMLTPILAHPVPVVWDGVEHEPATPAAAERVFRSRVERLKRKGLLVEKVEKQERVELHVLHTSCGPCVFAEYDATQTQYGCALGRLDKYRAQGAEVVEAYDDEKEFFIVNGRSCPAFRDAKSEWAAKVHPENRAAAVRGELTARTDVLIPLLSGRDVERMAASLDSVRALALKPSSVVVLNNQSDVRVGAVVAQLTRVAEGLNWKVVDVAERDADGNRPGLGRCVDLAAGKLGGHFYTVLPAGSTLPPEFTRDLDRAVVDGMARFVVLTPNAAGVGLTVGLGFHKAPMVDGNKPVVGEEFAGYLFETPFRPDEPPTPCGKPRLLAGVVEKAEFLARERESPHLVEKAEVVCPALA